MRQCPTSSYTKLGEADERHARALPKVVPRLWVRVGGSGIQYSTMAVLDDDDREAVTDFANVPSIHPTSLSPSSTYLSYTCRLFPLNTTCFGDRR